MKKALPFSGIQGRHRATLATALRGVLLFALSLTASGAVPNLAGVWTVTENATLRISVGGQSQNQVQSGTGDITLTQSGNTVTYYQDMPSPEGGTYRAQRVGTISGTTVTFTGIAMVPGQGLTFSKNSMVSVGTISQNDRRIDATSTVDVAFTGPGVSGTVKGGGTEVFVSKAPRNPPTITTTSPLPAGTVGKAYRQLLTATGGVTPYTWSLASGSLPPGLTLNGDVISGTPTVAAIASLSVRVSGGDGLSSTTAFTLTINPAASPPKITLEPKNQEVRLGEPATFTVGATGSLPLRYQWKKDGRILAGATSPTYSIPTATQSDAGSYAATVANDAGSAESQPATLVVLACVNWRTPGDGGDFDTGTEWLGNRSPGIFDPVCLDGAGTSTTVLLNTQRLPPTLIRGLTVEEGFWELDLRPTSPLSGSTAALRLASTGDGLVVRAGGTLKVTGGSIETPSLRLEPGSVLDARGGGTITVLGDWLPRSTDTTTLVLGKRISAQEVRTPILRIEAGPLGAPSAFAAAGKLVLAVAPGYRPTPGDRVRLIEFRSALTDLDAIAARFRFRGFDPEIVTENGIDRENFWGLVFRQEILQPQDLVDGMRTAFVEAVVLRKPRVVLNEGVTRPLAKGDGGRGLVFVTHGTMASINAAPDGGLGEVALRISEFIKRRQLGDRWKVVILDWNEYATRADAFSLGRFFAGDGAALWNPATSAQFGVGIAESIASWMNHEGLEFEVMHVMSHSSGSWLANRFLAVDRFAAELSVTFFDAFAPPGYPCPAETGFWCHRFDGVLGFPQLGGDFVEHYVDRTPLVSPLGTNERLPWAVNFDVTDADKDSKAWVERRRSEPTAILEAHGWPYVWYLSTIQSALSGADLTGECGGFGLSPVYMESLGAAQVQRALLRSRLIDGSETDVRPNSCGPARPVAVKIIEGLFGNAVVNGPGTIRWVGNRLLEITTTLSQGGGSPGMQAQIDPQHAFVSVPVEVTRPVSEVRFVLSFPSGGAGRLNVSWDGAALQTLAQSDIGTNNRVRIDLRIAERPTTATHVLAFELVGAGPGATQATLEGLEFLYDLSPSLSPPARAGTGMAFRVSGSPVATQHVLETSTNLTLWTVVGPLGDQGPVSEDFEVAPSRKYYRVRVEGIAESPVFVEQPTDVTVDEGQRVVLAATVAGNPPLGFQWQRSGTNLPNSLGSTLVMPSAGPFDPGAYVLVATNRQGVARSRTVQVGVRTAARPPLITRQPESVSAVLGGTANFTVEAVGTAPLQFVWKRGATAIPGETSATLRMTRLTPSQFDSYSVEVSNAYGRVTSDVVELTLDSGN